MPTIGFLRSIPLARSVHILAAFRRGLAEAGHVEERNIAVEYRWADNQPDRLAAMALDLVARQVRLIVTSGGHLPVAMVQKATRTLPIVFVIGDDPVQLGFVSSLGRPGGNLTGITQFTGNLEAKRFELLRELLPHARRMAALVNPSFSRSASRFAEVEAAAKAVGLNIVVATAASDYELETAFSRLARERVEALLVIADPYYFSRNREIVALAKRYRIPAMYQSREYAEAGGLASYGTDFGDAHRQVGAYVDRILKGANPAHMPVQQSTKIELLVNVGTARALGIAIPEGILARANEVID